MQPFKGLLFGLFFITITVGAGIDFGILFGDFATIIGLTLGVIVVKGVVLYGLAHLFSSRSRSRPLVVRPLPCPSRRVRVRAAEFQPAESRHTSGVGVDIVACRRTVDAADARSFHTVRQVCAFPFCRRR